MNAKSVRNNADDLPEYINEGNIFICTVTEMWLTPNSNTHDKIILGNLTTMAYKLLHVPCSKTLNKSRGSSVAVIYREHLKLQKQTVNGFKSFGCV